MKGFGKHTKVRGMNPPLSQIKKTGRWYYDMWSEGKYVDLWSLNHVVTGIIMGLFSFIWKIPYSIAMAVSGALMLAWEFFEHAVGIKEHVENRAGDVLTGLAGFALAGWAYTTGKKHRKRYLALWMGVSALLNAWGFFAHAQRELHGKPEERPRAISATFLKNKAVDD